MIGHSISIEKLFGKAVGHSINLITLNLFFLSRWAIISFADCEQVVFHEYTL